MCNANPQILNIIFAPLSTTFALILDSLNQITTAIDKDALVTIICDGFYHLALFISNTSSATCCMDELMLCLSRISDILKPLSYSKSYAKKEISHLLFIHCNYCNTLYSTSGFSAGIYAVEIYGQTK
eukprot:921550_1